MADKQQGTGARGKQDKVKGQGHNETGNDIKTSTNNRSRQKKERNNSSRSTGFDSGRS
jgi:hypothetical protein